MRTETTILMEIEVPVTYDIIPGQVTTWDEPGFDADVDDFKIDWKEVKAQINKEIESQESTDQMLEDGIQQVEEQRADFLYEQMKERQRRIA
jgi:hypothetical protein